MDDQSLAEQSEGLRDPPIQRQTFDSNVFIKLSHNGHQLRSLNVKAIAHKMLSTFPGRARMAANNGNLSMNFRHFGRLRWFFVCDRCA
jgi:hypothetical protein